MRNSKWLLSLPRFCMLSEFGVEFSFFIFRPQEVFPQSNVHCGRPEDTLGMLLQLVEHLIVDFTQTSVIKIFWRSNIPEHAAFLVLFAAAAGAWVVASDFHILLSLAVVSRGLNSSGTIRALSFRLSPIQKRVFTMQRSRKLAAARIGFFTSEGFRW